MASENSKQYVYPNKYLQACIEKEREEEEELCNHAPCRRCLIAIESNTDDQIRELKEKIEELEKALKVERACGTESEADLDKALANINELEMALEVERLWGQKVLGDMSKTAKALSKLYNDLEDRYDYA